MTLTEVLRPIEVHSINVRYGKKRCRAFPLLAPITSGKIRFREPRYFVTPEYVPPFKVEPGITRRPARS